MLDKKTVEKIREDFPDKSVQVKKTFKDAETGEDRWLTGYKPQYIFERLNDVFGHDGWDYEILQHGIEGKDAWVLGRLTIYDVIRDKTNVEGPFARKILSVVEQFGTGVYNKGTSLGDAMKGAATNALEKCASLKDVGHKAYKGLQDVPKDHPNSKTINQSKTTNDYNKNKVKLLELCREYKIGKEAFPTLVKTVLKEEKSISDMTAEEIQALVTHVEKNQGPF